MDRARFLKDTEITGRDVALANIPEFDFYQLRRVLKLVVAWEHRESQPLSLVLTAQYEDEQDFCVSIRFLGIRQLRLPEMHDHGWWLSELEIEDLSSDQLEGIGYKALDHGDTSFCILCREIEIISCEPERSASDI